MIGTAKGFLPHIERHALRTRTNWTRQIRSEHMHVVGHRGCKGLLPENTIPGFLHAMVLGVDFAECEST